VVSNSTPDTYYPVPAPRQDPIQTTVPSFESVERALAALNLSTDNPIKSDLPPVNKSFDAEYSFDTFDTKSSNMPSSDFIAAVAASLDEFHPGLFYTDEDINFERDFGTWFNDDFDAKSSTPENDAKGKGKEIKEEAEFSPWDTEFSSTPPLFASPSPSIFVSEQHHLPANSRGILPPPGPTLRRRDHVSKNVVNPEPSINAVTSHISLKDLENFEMDFGQWFDQGAVNSALDCEFEASDFDFFDRPAGR
jgi:hypothetical protein